MSSSKSPESKNRRSMLITALISVQYLITFNVGGKFVQNKPNKGNVGLNKLRTIVKVHVNWLLSWVEMNTCSA